MRPNIDIKHRLDGAVQDYGEERDMDKQEAYSELISHAIENPPLNDDQHNALIEWVGDKFDQKYAEKSVENARTFVIKDYVSASVGYRGDLILAIFGYPETYTLFEWNEDEKELTEIEREA